MQQANTEAIARLQCFSAKAHVPSYWHVADLPYQSTGVRSIGGLHLTVKISSCSLLVAPTSYPVHQLSVLYTYPVHQLSVLYTYPVHQLSVLYTYPVHQLSVLYTYPVHQLSVLYTYPVHQLSVLYNCLI